MLNEIIKNKKGKKVVNDMSLAANEFNYYFVGVGPGLAEEFAKSWSINDVVSKNVNINKSMFVKETDEKEIIEIVKTFKNKKSTDWNGIDMFIVKIIISCVVKPLTHVCNQSLKIIFPDKMKMAKVIARYKAVKRHTLSNCRPVSLLSQFSKILEQIFFTRLE